MKTLKQKMIKAGFPICYTVRQESYHCGTCIGNYKKLYEKNSQNICGKVFFSPSLRSYEKDKSLRSFFSQGTNWHV